MAAIEEVGGREIGPALLEDGIGPLDAVDPELVARDQAGFALVEDDFEVELAGGREGRGIDRANLGELALCEGKILAPRQSSGTHIEL